MSEEKQERICPKCGKPAKRFTKGTCHNCYRKTLTGKLITCPRCGQLKKHQAGGLCRGCYNSVFFIDNIKEANAVKQHGMPIEAYRELTKECKICGFDKGVFLTYIDGNHNNKRTDNLVGLCPNHAFMFKDRRYKKEIFVALEPMGYKIPEGYPDDEEIKAIFKQNITERYQ